ncbi:fibronectin type III domain-containing protein [Mesobacillus sp. S13]|uniref:fibronectin type III domain-containing protein n=1 Tax=Mesobacillus sp. S13 TaxID=2880221 RepID=UPI001CF57325|nr:fibronectin type III domain-containing protein [Mesobacillus sp. S13]
MRKTITNFVLNFIHTIAIAKQKAGWEGRTIRYTRLRKFKKKGRGLLIAAKILALWYLLVLTGSYLTADTGAYFNDVETISETITIADNFCADEEWANEHKQYCKDNAGIGNGCEPGDDCDSEKGEDEDNPGHNRETCGDHTSAPCSEGSRVSNINATQTSSTITLTWTNPSDNKFKSIKVYRNGEPAPIAENITSSQFEDTGLLPDTKYIYYIVEVNNQGDNLGTAIFEVSTNPEQDSEQPQSEAKPTEAEANPTEPEQDTQSPGEVIGPSGSETGNSGNVELSWTPPSDSDFSHVRIYRDEELVADNVKSNNYSDQVSEKNHSYKITTVDTSGNESPGVPIEVTWHK